MIWVSLGFFITFILFFMRPIFFDPSLTMQFRQYLPVITPIGHDFRVIASLATYWVYTGKALPTLYPPFTLFFFSPFAYLSSKVGYEVITFVTLGCYILSTLALPRLINNSREIDAFTLLIFISGIISYGFQFELERGQWNTIAMMFCLASIYLFHRRPKYRWLAYLLFSISVQLKLFPAIFALVLVEDWHSWKQNIKRLIGLGLFNILALFILGTSPILSTMNSLNSNSASIGGVPFNLSTQSFTLFFLTTRSLTYPFLDRRMVSILLAHSWILQSLFVTVFVLCFIIVLWQAYRKNSKGFDAYVFLTCAIGAYILPTISFDYKLSFFPACIIFSVPNILPLKEGKNSILIMMSAFILSIAYSSTLYSYENKPPIIQNNLPALLVILVISTALSCVRTDDSKENLAV